ncbi:MAG: hypothetical protein R2863_02205 [Candidatus Kapaibacterium sp.]
MRVFNNVIMIFFVFQFLSAQETPFYTERMITDFNGVVTNG